MPPGHFTAQGWLKKEGRLAFVIKNCTATTTPPVPPVATTTPDVTAPAISNVVTSSIASTSAVVSWITSENATGKIYYGTANPLATSSATVASSLSLTLGHSFSLSGLTASTTYNFILESKDASGNATALSQQSFTTLHQ